MAISEKVVVHVAETEISEASGMGRVAYHWRQAFLDRGYKFIHIGPAELGGRYPKSLFPLLAWRHYQRLRVENPILLLHEPVGGVFLGGKSPAIVFSHGLERRASEVLAKIFPKEITKRGFRGLMTAPLWKLRAWACDAGLRRATGALIINQEDAAYARVRYRISPDRMLVFRNGVNPVPGNPQISLATNRTVLFLGSWLKRKGIDVLAETAKTLSQHGHRLQWLLGGTGVEASEVLRTWPAELHASTEILPKFAPQDEAGIIARCSLYLLPSRFEGQPLSLLQAMAWGRCCFASACCGQKDLIRHGENGLLHEAGNAMEMASQIERGLLDPVRMAAMGEQARRSVQDRGWSQVSSEVVSFVEAMVQRERRGEGSRSTTLTE
jgi:glycosyltransferase involved in cell wall biosynthesis